jgi:coatomer subunit beta
MVIVLKKELSKTNNTNDLEDMDKYRQILIRGLHQLSIKFPDIAVSIIPSNFNYKPLI